jgi:hypothetical protein
VAEISMRDFCEALYCALAPLDAFSLGAEDCISFVATATDQGATSEYHVQFQGVRQVSRERQTLAKSEPGDRIELSVIELEREVDGWRVWFNPWYLEEIEFRCTRIALDDREVTGVGRWLQDELPDQSAV